jgi:IMP dehydrogenase
MATCGYKDLAEFNRAELMIAPSLQTEGKALQASQGVGMGARGTAAAPPRREGNGNGSPPADAPEADKTPALTGAASSLTGAAE